MQNDEVHSPFGFSGDDPVPDGLRYYCRSAGCRPATGDWFDVTDKLVDPPVVAQSDTTNLAFEVRESVIDRADVHEVFPGLSWDGSVYIEAFISRDEINWYDTRRTNAFWAYWENNDGLYVSIENAQAY